MKTKICAVAVLFFLIACGSGDQTKQSPEKTVKAESSKYIIKASNMQYLAVTSDTTLLANQPNPEKAEVFEKVDLGNGKSALRTLYGKYVSDNNGLLKVNKNAAGESEMFEIVALDQLSATIKASSGKYVSCNPEPGSVVVVDRDKAGGWEIFTMEQK
jgi:hypothetical protein